MPRRPEIEYEQMLTPFEVARMFRVDAKTVAKWANAGKLTSVRTLGNHRRFKEAEVRALLNGGITNGHAAVCGIGACSNTALPGERFCGDCLDAIYGGGTDASG